MHLLKLLSILLIIISNTLPAFVKIGYYSGITSQYCGYQYVISQTKVKPQPKCFKHQTNSSTIVDSIGTKPLSNTNRIYGGSDTEFIESPWTVYIKYDSSWGSITTNDCTGTLINKQWVITAAQCNYKSSSEPNKYSRIRVFLRDSRPGRDGGISVLIHPKHVFRHKFYNKFQKISSYDIALYKLWQSVDINIEDGINYPVNNNTLCLPTNHTIYNVKPELTTMYGWGGSKYIPIGMEPIAITYWQISPDILQKSNFLLNANNECPENFLCSLKSNDITMNTTGCDGDTGAGIIQYTDNSKTRAVLVGIYINRDREDYTIGCADNTKALYWIPVAKHIDWILNTIQNNS